MYNFLAVLISLLSYIISTTSGSSKSGQGLGCVKTITASRGQILSPNFGAKYPAFLACKWTIKAQKGDKISLSFKDFVIERSTSCRADYLLLFDGPNNKARLVGRYCVTAPAPFTSSSNYLHMEFHSDSSVSFRGFYAVFSTSLATTAKPSTWQSSPKFLSTVVNKTAVVGDIVHFLCEVDGTPEPDIIWKKNSQNLAQDDRVMIGKERFKSILSIRKVNKTDQGRYSCEASNGFGPPIQSHGFLVVKDREIPLITNTTLNQTATVGQNITLTCEAEGLAPMKIFFRERKRVLKVDNCEQPYDCRLRYPEIFFQDTVVTCVVHNNISTTSRDIHIKVKGPPFVVHSPQNKTVQVGHVVNFTCVAVGNPPLEIKWLKDNSEIYDGFVTEKGHSTLSLSVNKTANLTCLVKGKDGETSTKSATIIVKEAIKITKLHVFVVPKTLKVDYEQSANVSCNASGFPEPRLSWTSNDSSLVSAIRNSNGVSTLELKSLKKTVTVICFATNTYETINSSATVTVRKDIKLSAQTDGKSESDNLKLILGAGGGVLVLTVLILFFIIRRRKRNKKIERDGECSGTDPSVRENEKLISNPTFSNKEDSESKPGVEMLHYPRENIALSESITDASHIEMFLGRAKDLPFSPGEHNVAVRAIKDPNPSEDMTSDFDVEASLLANLVHPNVVRLMAVCIKTPPLGLVFEYSNYGYLDEYLRKCDLSELHHTEKTSSGNEDIYAPLANVDRLSIAKQIASGMKYLTGKGYIHQELRARNCLVFKDLQVKVANLGLNWAKPDQNFFVMEPEEKKHFPVRWLPPEVVLYGEYAQSTDVWSYGVVVWEIFSNGQQPYTGISDNDVVSYVRGYNILPRPKECPHNVYEVLKSCWEMAPLERPDFKSLHETMTALHAGVSV